MQAREIDIPPLVTCWDCDDEMTPEGMVWKSPTGKTFRFAAIRCKECATFRVPPETAGVSAAYSATL